MAALVQARETGRTSNALKISVLIGVILAGTGGVTQFHSDGIGYSPSSIRFIDARGSNILLRTQVQIILEELEISNVGLARALGVSRQTIYNWLNGAPLTKLHQAKVNSLSQVCEILLPLNLPRHQLLTQAMDSGLNFWQLIENGADAKSLALRLKASYERRSSQRSLMAERIAAKRVKGTLANFASDELS